MDKTVRVLAGLLVVQVVLAIGLGMTGTDLSAKASDTPLLALEADAVDSLTIEAPEESPVALVKTDSGWRLPGQGGFPVENEKAPRMLRRLASLQRGQPVATSEGAQRRFQVSKDNFERRVVLAKGGKTVGTVYLGSSAKGDRVYARAGDDDAVYAVSIATYEIPAKAQEWEDKTVLAMPKEEIEAIEVAGIRLERVNDAAPAAVKGPAADTSGPVAAAPPAHWRASGLTGRQRLDTAAAANLAKVIAELQIGEVLGHDEKSEYGLGKPVVSFAVTRKGGKRVEYHLGQSADGGEYTLHVSTRPEYFRLYSYGAKPLVDAVARDTLIAGS